MKLFTTVAAALAASRTVSAHNTTHNTTCAAPTATTTEIVQHLNCRRIVCIKPSRTCSTGEPMQPKARPPYVINTVTPESSSCTAVAEAIDNPGCNLCPTCLAAPVVRQTDAAAPETPTPTVEV